MKMDYIIVQAGGKGTRMEHLTKNKPKALVPVNNLPILFYLFRKYPEKQFLVIGDYKFDVLEKYLSEFADVQYKMIDARGKKGTCAGIQDALDMIPENESFMLIWCDLILSNEFEIPFEENDYIGISKDFKCRWKYQDDKFDEEASTEYGVAGHFIFKSKESLKDIPREGEFVRWLKENDKKFIPLSLYKTKEYGMLKEYNSLEVQKCRPFNRITFNEDYIIKEGIDEQGVKLAKREVAWYQKIRQAHFHNIPQIYEFQPLKMERINGKNIYEYELDRKEKEDVLIQLINCIKDVHNLESVRVDNDSYYEAYIGKTFERLQKVYNLVPFAKQEFIRINDIVCPNIFFHRDKVEELVKKYIPKEFKLLHGDCTFSNMLLKDGKTPVMIDPRGYFGYTEFYGDPAYDWAKLYYSIVGNYDQFNLKRFSLDIDDEQVKLEIESNNWEEMEDLFFDLLGDEVTKEQMKILHAIIWLSLTTYAWEDYDSICGAFYKGILLLNEIV